MSTSFHRNFLSVFSLTLFVSAISFAIYQSIKITPIYNTNPHAHLFEDLVNLNAPYLLLALISYGIYKKTHWSKNLLFITTGLTTLFLIIDITATILHKHSFNYNDKSSLGITLCLVVISYYIYRKEDQFKNP